MSRRVLKYSTALCPVSVSLENVLFLSLLIGSISGIFSRPNFMGASRSECLERILFEWKIEVR
jgi:hypothetical protein